MMTTYQFKNQSIMEHGISVHKHYRNIIKALDSNDSSFYDFPDILKENWSTLKPLLYSIKVMKTYHIYHDCGKPYCRTIDEQGKQHFFGHADKSYEIFTENFADDPNCSLIGRLIQNDMIFHSGKAEEIEDFINYYKMDFIFSLWLTSFAELYSNKEMFDESQQLSFKIKYKKLSKCLKRIIENERNRQNGGRKPEGEILKSLEYA